ncbi:glycosyltransferase family A protein [Rhizobium sp. Rhizsp42]|jgi:glycosyltransferase involved in cell wall biosynthesis|uniref:glycosyltransferase family 2 protein n=1 Tax=Rhizobium sp. Rhizsp42 TaxID=3243034 RepID=UPI000DD9BAF6
MVSVQVLIPCYNYAKYLERSVHSALSQPGVDVNVLVIDDCSPDDTPDVCRRLTAQDSRVRTIRHETNMGHIATYNEGIAQIRGDYFVLLSADDLLAPGALSRATALMEANPSVGMTYGHVVSFDGNEPPQARLVSPGTSVWSGTEWIRKVCRAGKNFVVCPEAVVRASVQTRIGGYDPKLPHSGDMEMWLRIASISDIGHVAGADQAYYRVHPQSMQRTIHSGFLFDLVGRREAFRSAFAKEGASLPGRDKLHLLAKRSLALTAIQHARMLCDFPNEDTVTASEYRDFAVSIFPPIVNTGRYRSLLASERQDKGALSNVMSQCKAKLRRFAHEEILNRVEYRWARRTGVYIPRYYL